MKCINFNKIITSITIIIPLVISKSIIYDSEDSEPEDECFSLSHGYKCCETCNVVEKGKEGDWGIENHKWCGIKYSCYENIKCFSEPYFPCCKENKVVLVDEEGEWGIENKKWCGISSSNNTSTTNPDNKDKNEKGKNGKEKGEKSKDEDEKDKNGKGKNEKDKNEKEKDKDSINNKDEKDKNNKNISDKDEKDKQNKEQDEVNKHDKDKNEKDKNGKEKDEKDKNGKVNDEKDKHDKEHNEKDKDNKDVKDKDKNEKDNKEQSEKDKDNKDVKGKDKNEKDNKEQSGKDKDNKDVKGKDKNEKDNKEQSGKDKDNKDIKDKDKNEKDNKEQSGKDKDNKDVKGKDKNEKDSKEQSGKDKDNKDIKDKDKNEKDKDSTSQNTIKTSLPKVNMKAWKYNAEDDVYWQVDIQYCENPPALNYETLGIFIPGKYVNATKNDKDDTYTCTINSSGVVGPYSVYNAPIVIPLNTKGYMSIPSPQNYVAEAKRYTKEGIIYVFTGFRGRYEGAPLGITDIKAAVRYLRYNDDILPGSAENIFTFGFGSGGALSVIMGTSGNSPLYDKYLKDIGAVEGVSDAIKGSMSWSPDASPDMANEAYEWNMGITRQDLDDFDKNLSDDLANAYAEYVNKIQLKDSNGKTLTLTKSDNGIYQSGSYYDYILKEIETSLNEFIEKITFPYIQQPTIIYFGNQENYGMDPLDDDKSTHGGPITIGDPVVYKSLEHYIYSLNMDSQWVTYDKETKKIHVDNLEGFVRRFKRASKNVAAFDDLEAMEEENVLFGYGNDLLIGSHFDRIMNKLLKDSKYSKYAKDSKYFKSFEEDLKKTDSLNTSIEDRVNMYNPLYYLNPYYKGYKSSDVAKYWRINAGITQTETPLTTEYNLKLALENYGHRTIDFDSVWNTDHIKSELSGNSTDNFIKWINKCLKMK